MLGLRSRCRPERAPYAPCSPQSVSSASTSPLAPLTDRAPRDPASSSDDALLCLSGARPRLFVYFVSRIFLRQSRQARGSRGLAILLAHGSQPGGSSTLAAADRGRPRRLERKARAAVQAKSPEQCWSSRPRTTSRAAHIERFKAET